MLFYQAVYIFHNSRGKFLPTFIVSADESIWISTIDFTLSSI